MYNTSKCLNTTAKLFLKTHATSWILTQTTTAVAFITMLFILISLIRYTRRYLQSSSSSSSSSSSTQSFPIFSAIASICSLLINIALTEALLINAAITTGELGSEICHVVIYTKSATTYLANLGPYLFLWYRQHTLYQRPAISHLNTAAYKLTSKVTCVGITVGSLVVIIARTAISRYEATPCGCRYELNLDQRSHKVVIVATLALNFSAALTLGSLYLNALVKTKASPQQIASGEGLSKVIVYRRVKRYVMYVSACLLSDLLAAVAVGFMIHEWSRYPAASIIDVTLAVNNLAVLFCFEDRRKILRWR